MRAAWMRGRCGAGLTLAVLLVLAGCDSAPVKKHAPAAATKPGQRANPGVPVLPPAGSGRGGYYKDDGPGDNPPPNLDQIPDAELRIEPYSTRSNRPYVVFGRTYTPLLKDEPFVQTGLGTWYGKKFHGQRTSSGEIYDMYKMTAAHPTLPIPSYARLTSAETGKQVIVRINDRGPFHLSRVIDVSYAAALKLGFLGSGSHELTVERLLPADIERILAERQAARDNPPRPPMFNVPALADSRANVEALMADDRLAAVQAPPAAAAAPAAFQSGASAPAVAPPASEDAAAKGAFYLQLGAFSQANNAEASRAMLAPYASSLGILEVVQSGEYYRLYGGPYDSRLAAARAAQALPPELNLKPVTVQR